MKNGFTKENTNGAFNDDFLKAMNKELKELYPEVDSDNAAPAWISHYSEIILERAAIRRDMGFSE